LAHAASALIFVKRIVLNDFSRHGPVGYLQDFFALFRPQDLLRFKRDRNIVCGLAEGLSGAKDNREKSATDHSSRPVPGFSNVTEFSFHIRDLIRNGCTPSTLAWKDFVWVTANAAEYWGAQTTFARHLSQFGTTLPRGT
jgi:hypothetical protein